MTGLEPTTLLIVALALGTALMRFGGYALGASLGRRPRAARLLEALPGCLVVALVASGLAAEGPLHWLAAAACAGVAALTGNLVVVMATGLALAAWLGLG